MAAGLLVSASANVKVVQHQMGDTPAGMPLDTYADLSEEDLNTVGQATAGLFRVEPQ